MRKKRTDSRTNRLKSINVKSRFRTAKLIIAMILTTGFLIACGGGGGDDTSSTTSSADSSTDTVSALTMPDRISITSVDDSDSSRSIQSLPVSKAGLFRAYSDAGTDYQTQQKDVWVEDTDALDMVNDILAVVQDTGYDDYVNEGPYKALVQEVGDSEQSGGGTSTTSTTTEELMEITVDVSRVSNTSPMIVKVWVLEEDGPGGDGMLIRGHFTVTEGVSADYPYGQLEAHFVGVKLDENGNETEDEVMTMAIKVDADDDGNVVVQCVDQGAEDNGSESFEWNNQFRLVSNAGLSEGQAYVNVYEAYEHPGGSGEEDYVGYIAYNENFFKEKEAGASEETVYDKNSLHHKVYRYKLFDADSGDKVSMNGGFPITLETGEYGYIGYWGLWVNDGVVVENGDTVTDMDGNEYTVFTVGGKLRKHTKTQVTLAQLTDVEMSMWDSTEGVDYIIAWDGTQFKKIGYRNNETGQVEYGEYGAVTFANEWDGAWCESLNAYMGLGRLYADGMPAVTNDSVFSFHSEETIDPSTAENWTFYYWGPVVGQTHEEYWMSNPTTATTLTFNAANLVLENNGAPQVDTTSEYGSWMSPLTTTEYTQENQWQAHDADIYYSWSTGPNQWDQYTALKNASNEFVSFTPPLHFSYVHSTANDLNGNSTHDGMTFNLDYDGSELHIPWNYDPDLDEWQPMFSLKDGTVLTDAESNSYVVKGIEVGVVMREAQNPADASDLVIDETIAAPTLTYDSSKTDLVGDKPTAELKVIKGETI